MLAIRVAMHIFLSRTPAKHGIQWGQWGPDKARTPQLNKCANVALPVIWGNFNVLSRANVHLGRLRLIAVALKLSLGSLRLGTFAWNASPEIFRLDIYSWEPGRPEPVVVYSRNDKSTLLGKES